MRGGGERDFLDVHDHMSTRRGEQPGWQTRIPHDTGNYSFQQQASPTQTVDDSKRLQASETGIQSGLYSYHNLLHPKKQPRHKEIVKTAVLAIETVVII